MNRSTLDAYLSGVGKHPSLPHTEMMELFRQLEGGDSKARTSLVQGNLRLVISIAKQYRGHNIPLEDLIQEGNIGLMKSIERFDWRKGFRFSTYATWWIRQAIGQHVLKRKRMIRLPAHAAGVQRKATNAADEFRKEFGTDPTQEELAEMIGVSDLIMKATFHTARDTVSLQSPVGSDPEGDSLEDRIESESMDPYDTAITNELVQVARDVLSSLSQKEVAVLRLRFGLVEDPTDSGGYPITADEAEGVRLGRGIE